MYLGRGKGSAFLSLGGGLLFAFVCAYGYSLVLGRADMPAGIGLPHFAGGPLVRIDDVDLRIPKDQEFALAFKDVGRPVLFFLRDSDGSTRTVAAPSVPYYADPAFLLVYFLVGLISIVLGTAARVLKPADIKARLFYWLALSFAVTAVIQGDSYGLRPARWTTFIPCLFFIVGYAFVPALFLHFSLAFLHPSSRFRRLVLYLPAALTAGVLGTTFIYAFTVPSIVAFRFNVGFFKFFRLYVIAYSLVAVVLLGLAHRRSPDEQSRSQIKWIFFGLSGGLAPYLLLYMVPRALGLAPLLSEEVTALFFAAFPATFAIAIIRHRFLDIDLIINRSLVYSFLTVSTVGIYLLIVQGVQGILVRVMPVRPGIMAGAGVFLAAAAFHPAQRGIQSFVDRSFFRRRYDFRRTIFDFNEQARRAIRKEDLLRSFVETIRRILPVESLKLAVRPGPEAGKGAVAASSRGGPDGEEILPVLAAADGASVLARSSAVRLNDRIDFSMEKSLETLGVGIAFPIRSSPGRGTEWLALGKKRSGERYSRDDIELLQTLANELAVNLDRLRLQEEVVYERASREKLDELNHLKTEFIASVSHEIRTPMSSIQGLAEILQAGKIKSREQREHYLNLMVAESGRLSRFLHNVLDFCRIEQRAKAYHFEDLDLRSVVDDAVGLFRPAAEGRGYRLEVVRPDTAVEARVDGEAVKQALINLIDNALKYSAPGTAVTIELGRADGRIEIRVRDRGIGVAPADLGRIFEKFFRAKEASRVAPQGAGLGLKIVKAIMEAHNGDIGVESEAGQGSTFRLIFPEP